MPIAIETASQPWRPVDLEGEGLIIVVLAFVLSFLSVLVVSLRIYVRTTIRFFGVDDWFMCIGTVSGLLSLLLLPAILFDAFSYTDNISHDSYAPYYTMQRPFGGQFRVWGLLTPSLPFHKA